MRILFCGGGTAGHITPAIAMAQELRKKDKSCQIMFVGREDGEENRAITKNGYNLATIKIGGFERRFTLKNIKNAYIALKSLGEAKKILHSYAPDAVIGTGGYVTWPIVRSASKMKIPCAIHESNAAPGLVTKLLAPKCDKVLLNLHGSEEYFSHKENLMVVGNPVREDFSKLTKASARKKLGIPINDFLITSFGGSGGSYEINKAAINLMSIHSSKNPRIRHIHATGTKYFNEFKEKYPRFANGNQGCLIKAYIDNMPEMISASDIVISRCGAMTIAEIAAAGVASILIPSPNVADNHQYKNAKLLCDGNAALMIEEKDLNERTLTDAVYKLENNQKLRNEIQRNVRTFYFQNSGEEIADVIIAIAKK